MGHPEGGQGGAGVRPRGAADDGPALHLPGVFGGGGLAGGWVVDVMSVVVEGYIDYPSQHKVRRSTTNRPPSIHRRSASLP